LSKSGTIGLGDALLHACEVGNLELRGTLKAELKNDVVIRPAVLAEQKLLEELQLRASLTNAGDRQAILSHSDAIELPLQQIAAGQVFVAE
jgi:hypothetical protein